MPPKKKEEKKGTQDAKKAKVVDDKTFGLKNKKGKKQQTYIKNVASQVQGDTKAAKDAKPKLSKKELEKQKLDELNELFKPVQKVQVVAAGVDPKSVLCNYFKNGTCQKGFKCKFSHDLNIERKSEKKNIYEDVREKDPDTMGDWDQDTLEEVINKKHGSTNTAKTGIICKFFLDAVEKGLYGWFWNCPNGDKCMYRHALPPGFVLKKDIKKEDEEDKVSLEEHIENERNELCGALTPVNKQTFLAWKKRKIEEKKEKLWEDMKLKKEEFKAGKGLLKISGKEVFLFKPELADEDDDEADDDVYMREVEEGEDAFEGCVDIDLNLFASEMEDSFIDSSNATKFMTLLPKDRETAAICSTPMDNDTEETDANGVAAACAQPDSNGVVIDESLFEELDDLDLDDLDLEDGDD